MVTPKEKGKKLNLHSSKSKAKTKVEPVIITTLAIVNTSLELLIAIVNVAVNHQKAKLKSLQDTRLKRIYEFKTKADSIKKGVCITIIQTNDIFIDLFDWLRIETFDIRYNHAAGHDNLLKGDFSTDKTMKAKERKKAEDELFQELVENDELCLSVECLKVVFQVKSMDKLMETMKKIKNQILDFQEQFCDMSQDIVGEESYYNARSKGILDSIYPKKTETKSKKLLRKVWGGFNDILPILEEVMMTKSGSVDAFTNFLEADEKMKGIIVDKTITDKGKYFEELKKWNDKREGFLGNSLIKEFSMDYVPDDVGRAKGKEFSVDYFIHLVTANPPYGSLGEMKSFIKSVWEDILIITGYTKISGREYALKVFELLQKLTPYITYLIFIIVFGLMGGSSLTNALFSVWGFNNVLNSFFDLAIAIAKEKCCDKRLEDSKNSADTLVNEIEELESCKTDSKKERNKAITGIIWYLFLLLFPFLFHAGVTWLIKILIKMGSTYIQDLMSTFTYVIIGIKIAKNVVVLILAIKKYYDLRRQIKKIEKEEDVEMKLRNNFLGNLGIQMQYVTIKFNMIIYNGLTECMNFFNRMLKIHRGEVEEFDSIDLTEYEDEENSEHNKEKARELFGEEYESLPEKVQTHLIDSITGLQNFQDHEHLDPLDLKSALGIKFIPKIHFIIKIATENPRLVYKYKKYILKILYWEYKDYDEELTGKIGKNLGLYLHKLYFMSPITNPIIFNLENFIDTPHILDYSPLYIMKHESFPSDYMCLYQKSFYSNSYLKDIIKYSFSFKDTKSFDSYITKVSELTKDKSSLTDIYYMSDDKTEIITAVIFTSNKSYNHVNIENFNIKQNGEGGSITFNNEVYGDKENLEIIPFFSETFYDNGNNSDGTIEIDLKSFNIKGKKYENFISNFEIIHVNPFTDDPNEPKNNFKCNNQSILLGYYYANCDAESQKKSNYHRLFLCSGTGNFQHSYDERENVIRNFILPKVDTVDCDSNFLSTKALLPEEKDNDEFNLLLDIQERSYDGTGFDKPDVEDIEDPYDNLGEVVSVLKSNVRKGACKNITKLKNIIYGCHASLVPRKKEFLRFLIISKEEKMAGFKDDFYNKYFFNKDENKLEPPTLSQFREKMHFHAKDKCGLNIGDTREESGDLTAFGMLYAQSEKPDDIKNRKNIEKALAKNSLDKKITVTSLKGKYLFSNLFKDKNENCFDSIFFKGEERFLFPLKKKDKINSLVFTIYYILPVEFEEIKNQNVKPIKKVHIVYALQDTNEQLLKTWENNKEIENLSYETAITGKEAPEEKPEKHMRGGTANIATDLGEYTVQQAKTHVGPGNLFKSYKYYFVEIWNQKPTDDGSSMYLADKKDKNGVIEDLIAKGFIPYWPKTVPVITNSNSFARDYRLLDIYASGFTKTEDGHFDYLHHYKEFEATSDFFFTFMYNEGSMLSMVGGSKKKVINYRIWIKYDFDMSKVEVELDCHSYDLYKKKKE